MKFNKIDLNTWKRKDDYSHFMNYVKCVIGLTADVEVTKLVKACKDKKLRFYPALIYIVSKVVNRHEEFRMGYNEQGEVGIFDNISPSYIVFNKEDETFTNLVTEYINNFNEFYGQVIKDIEINKDKRGREVRRSDLQTFDVSCLPWIKYNSLELHVFDDATYLAPVITWGKFEGEEKLMMPLSIQIHHAAADGFHIARFYNEVQLAIEELAAYLENN